MAKQYRVQKDGKEFFVYEVNSQTRIAKYDTYEAASNRSALLETGAGFNGWTPTFFTKDFKGVLENLWVETKAA